MKWYLFFLFVGIVNFTSTGWGFSSNLNCRLAIGSDSALASVVDSIVSPLKDHFVISDVTFDENYENLLDIRQKLQSLSHATKKNILHRIKLAYPYIRLASPSRQRNITKRLMDLILVELIDPYRYFSSRAKESIDLNQIIDEYFDIVRAITGGVDQVGASQVQKVSKRFQDLLKQYQPDDGRFQTVVLYGSFANGRAIDNKSDIDYLTFDERLLSQIQAYFKERKLEQDEIYSAFHFSEAQGHFRKSEHSVYQLSLLSPIVVFVHIDFIELRVYNRAGNKYLSFYL